MLRTDPIYTNALAQLSREMIATFGEEAVHTFGWQAAKTRGGGTKAVGTGGDAQKKALYGQAAKRALSRKDGKAGGKPKVPLTKKALLSINPAKGSGRNTTGLRQNKPPADQPHPGIAAQAVPTPQRPRTTRPPQYDPSAIHGPDAISAIHTGTSSYTPADRTAALAKLEKMKAAPPPPPPPPSPAEIKVLDDHHAADTRKYGPKAAGVLRGAAEALRGFLTLGGLVGGAYGGAALGGLVGGPLGMALGTAIGGGLGGLAGSNYQAIGRGIKGVARRVAPVGREVAGTLAGGAGAVLGTVAQASPMGMIMGPNEAVRPGEIYRGIKGDVIEGLGGGPHDPEGNPIGKTASPSPASAPGSRGAAIVRGLRKTAAVMGKEGSRVARYGVPATLGAVGGGTLGTMIGGPPGGVAGVVLGTAAGAALGHAPGATLRGAGKAVRGVARVGSNVAGRGIRLGRRMLPRMSENERFAEGDDALPPNAVAMLKVRLMIAARKAGVKLTLNSIPDEVVAKALELASQDKGIATSTNLAECVKYTDSISVRKKCP